MLIFWSRDRRNSSVDPDAGVVIRVAEILAASNEVEAAAAAPWRTAHGTWGNSPTLRSRRESVRLAGVILFCYTLPGVSFSAIKLPMELQRTFFFLVYFIKFLGPRWSPFYRYTGALASVSLPRTF